MQALDKEQQEVILPLLRASAPHAISAGVCSLAHWVAAAHALLLLLPWFIPAAVLRSLSLAPPPFCRQVGGPLLLSHQLRQLAVHACDAHQGRRVCLLR
jgi:hypothetical protein